MRTTARLILGAVVVAGVAACTSTEPGSPVPEASAPSVAAGPRTPLPGTPTATGPQGEQIAPGVAVDGPPGLVAAYRQARAIDPCALHDPAAAAEIADGQADQLMPADNLAECDLLLVPAGGSSELPTWRISAAVGVDWDDARAQDATAEQIGDLEVFLVPEVHDPDGRACTLVRPHGQGVGLQLQVRRQSNEPQPQQPCELARAYLAKTSAFWANPALRADGLSTPALPVADVDPCAGLGPVAAQLGRQARASMSEPHSCSLVASRPDGSFARARVALAVETDPRALLDGALAAEYKAVTVAGRPAVAHQTPADTGVDAYCLLTVITDESVTLRADRTHTDAPDSMQVVSARAPDCALATTAAEGVLALIP